MSKWHDTFSVHSHFTPTKKSQWVKEKLRVNLPADYPAESYPGFSASLAVKSQHSKTLTYSLAKSFRDGGVISLGGIRLDVSALRRSTFISLCAASTFLTTIDVALALLAGNSV